MPRPQAFPQPQRCGIAIRDPKGREDLAVGVSPRKGAPPTQSPGGAKEKDRSQYTSSLRPIGALGCKRPASGGSRRRPNPFGPPGRPPRNAANRSSQRHAREIAYLRRKWGPYLSVAQAKGTTRLVVKVYR
jgi:hypothetical protein